MDSILYHDPALRTDFSTLVAAALLVEGVDGLAATALDPVPHLAAARARLADTNEGGLPESRAWRAAFTAMGLKPTQYRCASESLLRRLRTQGDMPVLHPLIDFGNAVSAAFAIPLAIFDIDHVALPMVVTHAMGDERYITFAGEEEHPEPARSFFATPKAGPTPGAGRIVRADGRPCAHRHAAHCWWPRHCTTERLTMWRGSQTR